MISVTAVVVLALACVGLLIYFIAHIVNLIQSSTIVGRAHADTTEAIARLDDLGDSPEEPQDPWRRPNLSALLATDPLVIEAHRSGYVRHVDVEAVLDAVLDGEKPDGMTVVEIPHGPGAFVAAGLPLVRAWPARRMDDRRVDRVRAAVYLGEERSFRQDFAFGLRQLSDIALKGLSPGVNDPTTATQAMDRMEAIFVALGEKALPARVGARRAGGSDAYVKVGYYGFEDVVGLAFDQIRRAAFTSGQVAVLERLVEILGRAIVANRLPGRRRALWSRALSVARQAPVQVSDPQDAVNLVLRVVGAAKPLLGTGLRGEVARDLEELIGLSEGLPGGVRVSEAADAARAAGEKPG